jgi:hypothetical protein
MTEERTTIVRAFAGKRRIFRLRLGEIEELETRCAAGVGAIYVRIATNQHKFADVRETIRLAMIGGGAIPSEADHIVERYVDDTPLVETFQLASDILSALHIGAKAVEDLARTRDGAEQNDPKMQGSGDPATSPPTSPPDASQG